MVVKIKSTSKRPKKIDYDKIAKLLGAERIPLNGRHPLAVHMDRKYEAYLKYLQEQKDELTRKSLIEMTQFLHELMQSLKANGLVSQDEEIFADNAMQERYKALKQALDNAYKAYFSDFGKE